MKQHINKNRIRKHYLNPLKIKNPKPYNPKEFWTTFWNQGKITDKETISKTYKIIYSKYHYNSIENSIIEFLHDIHTKNLTVLDIGSGSGHWINFYLNIIEVKKITGLEISSRCVGHLQQKYNMDRRVEIIEGDITRFKGSNKYDIINAIGIMFHIIPDTEWKSVLIQFKNMLNPGGKIIIGGQFGLITQNVEFQSKLDGIYTYKRIRSLYKWKTELKKLDLKGIVKRTEQIPNVGFPENNILYVWDSREKDKEGSD